jgi:hypothetical protein
MGWQTDDVNALAGAPAAGDALTSYVFEAQGTQHVIYEGVSDHHIQEMWSDSSGWHTDDLTAATGAPLRGAGNLVGYAVTATGTQHVIYQRASDHHVQELWSDSAGWHTDDLTAATGAPPADEFGPLVAYAFEAQGTQHVIFSDANYSDRHLHELWWNSSGWHTDDITAATGAPHATGDLVGYAFEDQRTQHVLYQRVSDHHIQELWSDPAGWHADDLTALTGAPPASGPMAGYVAKAVSGGQGTQHVVYVGLTDKHIHELSWDAGGRHADDLTAATGAAKFGSGLAVYSFDVQGTQHVIYTDDNYPSHFHELWSDPRGWHTDDLTSATGAAAFGGGLAGYAFEAQGTQHVFYTSYIDDHVHELWWGPRAGGASPPTSGTTGGAATQIVNEVAVDPHGQPVNGYRESNAGGPTATEVDCTESSPAAVSSDIYYCSPTAASADVCWPAAPAPDLLCMDSPWIKDLHRVHARAPLPAVSPPHLPQPVALLLTDGNRCRLRNGGSWNGRSDGYVGAYSCGGGVAVLVQLHGPADPIDRSSQVWTIKLGKLGAPGESLPPPVTVGVATAWFAGNQ